MSSIRPVNPVDTNLLYTGSVKSFRALNQRVPEYCKSFPNVQIISIRSQIIFAVKFAVEIVRNSFHKGWCALKRLIDPKGQIERYVHSVC